GLTYDGFTRSVILPQGQFADFLAGAPDKRRDVLRSLLRLEVYEGMRDRAAKRAGEAKSALTTIDWQLQENFRDATPQNLEAKRKELAESEAEAASLTERLAALTLIAERAQLLDAARIAAATAEREAESAAGQLAEAAELLKSGS